jgi:hypothetical protein
MSGTTLYNHGRWIRTLRLVCSVLEGKKVTSPDAAEKFVFRVCVGEKTRVGLNHNPQIQAALSEPACRSASLRMHPDSRLDSRKSFWTRL